MSTTYRLIFRVEDVASPLLGDYARLPDGAIVSIGGTSNATFTVGGKPLLFADGTSTDGSSNSALVLSLQTAYNASPITSGSAGILLNTGKNFKISSTSGTSFNIDATSGDVHIQGNLIIDGLLNTYNATSLFGALTNHLNSTITGQHTASQIAVAPLIPGLNANNVQDALSALSTTISNQTAVKGYQHSASTASLEWIITHNFGTTKVQLTLWDEADHEVLPDDVYIMDNDNVKITFSSPQAGRAIVLGF